MFRSIILAGMTAVFPAIAGAGPIGAFSDLVVFGDSLSDPGNILAVTGGTTPDPALYPNGQFTNGDTWATKLGAGIASGTNFAFGGAKASTDADPSPDFAAQRALFALANPVLGARPLTAVWFGGNDLRGALFAADPVAVIGQAITDIVTGVNALVGAGLDDILVFGLPNLGRIPEVTKLGAAVAAAATQATLDFNAGLQGALAAFVPAGNVRFFDTFNLFESIAKNPGVFGFTNSTDACLVKNAADPTPCLGNSTFVFHDEIHPTDLGHAILANAVLSAVVPLPAGGLLLITGLGGLAFLRRRRA